MSEFEAQEIKARIALRDLEEKAKLIKFITKKGNVIIFFWLTLSVISWVIPYYLELNSTDIHPVTEFSISIIPLMILFSLIAFINHRFNSLVKLLEVDKYLLMKEENNK